MTHPTTELAPTSAASTRSRAVGGVSLVFMVSVLIGLALNPSGLPGSTPARHEGGTPPRQVEQIRCLAETIVRVATRVAKHDPHLPIAGVLLDELDRGPSRGLLVTCRPIAQVGTRAPVLREALLNLPPPTVG